MDSCFNTPVLFIVFNRPDTTRRVLDEIKKIRPQQLFVAADGPRAGKIGEKEKCGEVRQYVLDQIDWDCEVKTFFREENLGCGRAVSSAITWFFQNVAKGIILEDDCLPNPSFFDYCQVLLDYYEDNKKIMHISGVQFAPDRENGPSYYFAKIMHCWGWGGWADRWQYYDFNLRNYDEKNISNFSSDKNVQKYWLDILQRLKRKEIDTWDYQWTFKIVERDGLCINPSKNLVSNIGCGKDSTHDFSENNPFVNMPTFEVKKIIHPRKMEIDLEAVDYIYKHHCGIDFEMPRESIFVKIYSFLKRNGK